MRFPSFFCVVPPPLSPFAPSLHSFLLPWQGAISNPSLSSILQASFSAGSLHRMPHRLLPQALGAQLSCAMFRLRSPLHLLLCLFTSCRAAAVASPAAVVAATRISRLCRRSPSSCSSSFRMQALSSSCLLAYSAARSLCPLCASAERGPCLRFRGLRWPLGCCWPCDFTE